jgi:ubiquinone biosynthesis accessory factor UbiK
MINQKAFEELRARLEELLSRSPAKDIEKNMRALLTAFLNRLDLVTREEFDVQTEVLRRTREQLAKLEAKVSQLEHPAAPPERQ